MEFNKIYNIDINKVRADFNMDDTSKIYFDTAATSKKPNSVIEAISNYYKYNCGNPHSKMHYYANISSHILVSTREKIAEFIGADKEEIRIYKICNRKS